MACQGWESHRVLGRGGRGEAWQALFGRSRRDKALLGDAGHGVAV